MGGKASPKLNNLVGSTMTFPRDNWGFEVLGKEMGF